MIPLLQSGGLPLFDQIRPEHVGPAIGQLLAEANRALEQVTQPDFPCNWNAIAAVHSMSPPSAWAGPGAR